MSEPYPERDTQDDGTEVHPDQATIEDAGEDKPEGEGGSD